NESTGMDHASHVIDIQQIFGVASSPNPSKARANTRHRGQGQSVSAIVREVKADGRLGERERGERFYRAPPFRAGAAQEFETCRYVVEQLANGDSRPATARDLFGRKNLTARDSGCRSFAVGSRGFNLEH